MPERTGRGKVLAALAFDVQERRHRARALLEMRRRKAALLTLDTQSVVHRLHLLWPPDRIMDNRENDVESAGNDESKVLAETPDYADDLDVESQELIEATLYEEWVKSGFPVGSWRELLAEELYDPLEAEQMYFNAKYRTAPKGMQASDNAAESTAMVGGKVSE